MIGNVTRHHCYANLDNVSYKIAFLRFTNDDDDRTQAERAARKKEIEMALFDRKKRHEQKLRNDIKAVEHALNTLDEVERKKKSVVRRAQEKVLHYEAALRKLQQLDMRRFCGQDLGAQINNQIMRMSRALSDWLQWRVWRLEARGICR